MIPLKYGIDDYDFVKPLGGGCGYGASPPFLSTTIHWVYDAPSLYQILNTPDYNTLIGNDLWCVIGFLNNTNTNHLYWDYAPEIDLSISNLNLYGIPLPLIIPHHIKLIGYRGYLHPQGALLYTSDQNVDALFQITGPHVKIIGLRFGGYDLKYPHANPPNDPTLASRCIYTNQDDLYIENCEYFGWSHSAIYMAGITGSPNPLDQSGDYPLWNELNGLSPSSQLTATIKNSFIHDNKHPVYGYGIVLHNTKATISANIFDANRHSIIGTGVPGTSFDADHNLILPNSKGQAFVMLGKVDRFHHPTKHQYAGTKVNITYNSFWSLSHIAIYIDGFPETTSQITKNIFAEIIPQKAINNYINQGTLLIDDNIFGKHTVPQYDTALPQYLPTEPKTNIAHNYGIDAYDWEEPIGGGCGYSRVIVPAPLLNPITILGLTFNIFPINDAPSLLNALMQANGTSDNPCIIFIDPDAVIDLSLSVLQHLNPSAILPIKIPANTIFCSSRGYGDSQGALLYTTDKYLYNVANKNNSLFFINGQNVRITGLRIAGPDQAIHIMDHSTNNLVRGIYTKCDNFELDNCELYGWTDTPLRVDGGNAQNPPLINIYIHHNYIHHNQGGYNNPNGLYGFGYGMAFSFCIALVEANIFDYNRHSIECTGDDSTSYIARYNLQLNNSISRSCDSHITTSGNNLFSIHHNSFFLWDKYAIGLNISNIQYTSHAEITGNFFAQKPVFNSPPIPPSPTPIEDPNGNNDYINHRPPNNNYDYIDSTNPYVVIRIYDNKYGK